MIPPVVSVEWLFEHPEVVLVDVRWYLDGRSGRDAYREGHIPGASFLNLDKYLAAPPAPRLGRHPLPTPKRFAKGLRRAGASDDSTVVAYDDAGGSVAARVVWLLRLLDVEAAVLDGGLDAWPGQLQKGKVEVEQGDFTPHKWVREGLATIDDATTHPYVIDSRAPERYRGEVEPVDPRAGHIPGAINVFFGDNLAEDGRFLPPEQLRRRFEELGIDDATDYVVYCGSGVNACHNLIALEYAGLGRGRLYPGSWSQYANTVRPAATGPEPGTRRPIGPLGFSG